MEASSSSSKRKGAFKKWLTNPVRKFQDKKLPNEGGGGGVPSTAPITGSNHSGKLQFNALQQPTLSNPGESSSSSSCLPSSTFEQCLRQVREKRLLLFAFSIHFRTK